MPFYPLSCRRSPLSSSAFKNIDIFSIYAGLGPRLASVDVFREKSKQDWYFRETIVEYENKYDMRRNKHTFSDDAIEDAMHRIKNDIFCRHILEKREDIALLRLA
ncbi:unnamed protein product [Cuscuta epithymum]|uniref:Uncharacterized protein n=1 Tax=Cuscuta epithymum TaxID=186058 RepID=A0AAV0CSK5_9ASTE|nr:unnamed protein product [Cuscuta epithymum]